MNKRIYLDNNASTAVDPRVIAAVVSVLSEESEGNPSSMHSFGRSARQKLAKARETIASYLAVRPQEIIFTSGGTEGANALLRGLFSPGSKGHLITSNVEHSCIYLTAKKMESEGVNCSFLKVDGVGAVTPETVKNALRPDTKLITLMAVNNETGVKTDIESIAAMAKEAKVPFFVDGVALLGKEPFNIPPGVSAMFFSGHKLHAPKGIGFIVVRSSQKLTPLLSGGDQEYGRRAGTENLPGIVGLAAAIELLQLELPKAAERMRLLRDRLENELMQRLSGVTVNGSGNRVSNTSNLAFQNVDGESLLAALDLEGVAVSHGSACASGALEPSRILLEMSSKETAAGSIRLSLSRLTTLEEIDRAIEIIVKVVEKIRY